jgi:histidine decarboxylase
MTEDLNAIVRTYYLELKKKASFHAGYPMNLNFDYSELLSLFDFCINNLGDPFTASNYEIDSRDFEKEVVAFFAELYHCENYWGYVTSSGTEGNFYGLLLGRETYPHGILYASADSHYSVNKAARLFKIPHVEL